MGIWDACATPESRLLPPARLCQPLVVAHSAIKLELVTGSARGCYLHSPAPREPSNVHHWLAWKRMAPVQSACAHSSRLTSKNTLGRATSGSSASALGATPRARAAAPAAVRDSSWRLLAAVGEAAVAAAPFCDLLLSQRGAAFMTGLKRVLQALKGVAGAARRLVWCTLVCISRRSPTSSWGVGGCTDVPMASGIDRWQPQSGIWHT